MAFRTGTASNYKDLLSKFIDFVTNPGDASDGLLGSEKWVIEESDVVSAEHYVIFRAPGVSTTDSIYMGIKTFSDSGATTPYYNWQIMGYTGYNPAQTFLTQPGALDHFIGMTLDNQPFAFWFFGDGDYVAIVTNITGVFVQGYLGFIKRYGTPNKYPYPLFIGGNVAGDSFTDIDVAWQDTSSTTQSYWFDTDLINLGSTADFDSNEATLTTINCRIRSAGGGWNAVRIYPTNLSITNYLPSPGNEFLPVPMILYENPTGPYGEIKNVFWISGRDNRAGYTTTINSEEYLIFQDNHRSTDERHCAIKKVV